MRVLGLSAYHSEAAAALLVDGRPVAAAREETYTKDPLDASLPLRAARTCMDRAGLKGSDLDRVVFYEKPLRRFERTLVSSLRAFPRAPRGFAREVARWIGDRLWVKGRLAEELGIDEDRILFAEHQISHAACAYLLSPFQESGILVVDDIGEWATLVVGTGRGGKIEIAREVLLPNSLGLVVSAFTQFLGFDPGKDDEFLHDMALCGTPRFRDKLAEIVGVAEDGSPQIDIEYFRLGGVIDQLWAPGLERLFGPARIPGSPLRISDDDNRDADLAASLQAVLEERVLALAKIAREVSGSENLCFGGVLARNRGIVTRLLRDGGLAGLYVPPEPADAGAALGAALLVHHAQNAQRNGAPDAVFLGEALVAFGDDEREAAAESAGPESLIDSLVAGRSVGWARGVLEFTGHSLGHRSIFHSPCDPGARERLLGAMQRTESFLAGRIALPAERVAEFVELPGGTEGTDELLRLGKLQLPATDALRDAAPGAVHTDGSAWVQSVDATQDPDLHRLLVSFAERSGCPGLLHDTLRLRGSVVPRSDTECLQQFDRSGLAAMLVGDRLFVAPEGPA